MSSRYHVLLVGSRIDGEAARPPCSMGRATCLFRRPRAVLGGRFCWRRPIARCKTPPQAVEIGWQYAARASTGARTVLWRGRRTRSGARGAPTTSPPLASPRHAACGRHPMAWNGSCGCCRARGPSGLRWAQRQHCVEDHSTLRIRKSKISKRSQGLRQSPIPGASGQIGRINHIPREASQSPAGLGRLPPCCHASSFRIWWHFRPVSHASVDVQRLALLALVLLPLPGNGCAGTPRQVDVRRLYD